MMDDQYLVDYIGLVVPPIINTEINQDKEQFIHSLNDASSVLLNINSLYTPGEFLSLFKSCFNQINSVSSVSGDVILPSVVFIIIHSGLKHLGAYIHFLTDFAKPNSEEEYILVTYEAAYKFIQRQDSSVPQPTHTDLHLQL